MHFQPVDALVENVSSGIPVLTYGAETCVTTKTIHQRLTITESASGHGLVGVTLMNH